MKENYYAEKLNAGKLYKVYQTAIPRVRQYLDAEIDFVRKGLKGDERILELGVQCQHLGQGAVAVYALLQGLGVQAQLALHAATFFLQRGAQRYLAGQQHAQRSAQGNDQHGPEQSMVEKAHGWGSLTRLKAV